MPPPLLLLLLPLLLPLPLLLQGLGQGAEERLRAERERVLERLEGKRQALQVGGFRGRGQVGAGRGGRGVRGALPARLLLLLLTTPTCPPPPPSLLPLPLPLPPQDAVHKANCLSKLGGGVGGGGADKGRVWCAA